MLLHLFPELQMKVYSYLNTSELKKLACCHSELNFILKERLWGCVRVRKKHLTGEDFCTTTQQQQIDHLIHTRTLHVTAHACWVEEQEVISRNFQHLLKVKNFL